MLLKNLPAQDLGEQVSRVSLARDMLDNYHACTTKFAHLEQLAIDMTRVLGCSITVAEIERPLVVRFHLDWSIDLEPKEAHQPDHVSPSQ